MSHPPHSSPTAAIKNLRRIFVLRNVVIAFLCSTAVALVYFDIPITLTPIIASIGAMLLLNGWTWLRLRSYVQVRDGELYAQLLGDIAALTLLF